MFHFLLNELRWIQLDWSKDSTMKMIPRNEWNDCLFKCKGCTYYATQQIKIPQKRERELVTLGEGINNVRRIC